MEMGAIIKHYPIEDACLKATLAGHDMLLICSNYQHQKKGFEALVNGYDSSSLSAEELGASVERIRNIKNFCSNNTPLHQHNTTHNPEDIAQQIAQKSITIISDDKHLLPTDRKKVKDILLLIPDLSALPALEEGYEPTEEHFLIKECTHHFSGKLVFNFFSLNPGPEEIEQIARTGSKHSLCVVFISNAQENEGQRLLIDKLHQCENNFIFALMDNPFDLTLLNRDDTCITSYGFRKNQLLSLIKVIFGKAEAKGSLPFKESLNG
jgi:hypothetical protein